MQDQQRRYLFLDIIEKWNLNLLNLIFISLSAIMFLFLLLLSVMETPLPPCVMQFFRYGKFAYIAKDKSGLMLKLEVPKSWFSHFYIFAMVLSWWSMCLVVHVTLFKNDLPEYAEKLLDYVAGGQNRPVLIDSTTCLVAVTLICLHCSRRFYESNFVQIFSKKNKFNIAHYVFAYLHYFGAILAVLANAEGFVKGSTPSDIKLSKISWTQYFSIGLFLFCWLYQYKSNIILVNLRKDAKTGQIATDKHLLPKGGFFELVSSPHMLFEIGLYVAILIGFLFESFTWWFVVIWVVSNQHMPFFANTFVDALLESSSSDDDEEVTTSLLGRNDQRRVKNFVDL
ncbi:polyprenal reductase-like [Haematobia irritans]|uniref:polyprenal reductase-like n=1 Tax=Haematobia irritans TaxID=7368 RepID=UPI003F4F8056